MKRFIFLVRSFSLKCPQRVRYYPVNRRQSFLLNVFREPMFKENGYFNFCSFMLCQHVASNFQTSPSRKLPEKKKHIPALAVMIHTMKVLLG